MKRTATVVTLAIVMAIAGAGAALAKNYPPTPGGGAGGTGDAGGAGGGSGNVAFTGANVSLGMLLVAALVVVGVVALFIGRRRARV
ncbi:MAG: hypothetical protein M3O88_05300 [Actinomycetota bacterium]|nr:hypothetical protein [Actinomycetota bacterium]